MNTPQDDGGAAFPMHGHPEDRFAGYRGMSLRDYFAAAALQGILGYLKELGIAEKKTGIERAEGCACMAYHYADAMLAARKEAK